MPSASADRMIELIGQINVQTRRRDGEIRAASAHHDVPELVEEKCRNIGDAQRRIDACRAELGALKGGPAKGLGQG